MHDIIEQQCVKNVTALRLDKPLVYPSRQDLSKTRVHGTKKQRIVQKVDVLRF